MAITSASADNVTTIYEKKSGPYGLNVLHRRGKCTYYYYHISELDSSQKSTELGTKETKLGHRGEIAKVYVGEEK